MKLLVIGTDRKLFDPDSHVRARVLEQGRMVDEMHIIVFARKALHFSDEQIGEGVYIHPTRSLLSILALPDAFLIGRRIIGNSPADWIISTQDPFETGIVGYALSIVKRVPLHIQLHTDPFSAFWKDLSLLNHIRYLCALFLLRAAQAVRVVSRRVYREVRALGVPDERITVVPIFVDTKMYLSNDADAVDLKEKYPGYGKFILSAGRLEYEKDFPSLLRAFKEVRKSYDDAVLLIVGSGSQHDRLVAYAEFLGVDRHVHILPWAHDLRAYYKSADVYVQPSLYEGWGMGVIEAAASGAPVVMTNVGCAGEVIVNEASGLVVPPADHRALADAILRLFGDHGLRDRLVEGAKKAVESLVTKEETLELYQKSWEQAVSVSSVSPARKI